MPLSNHLAALTTELEGIVWHAALLAATEAEVRDTVRDKQHHSRDPSTRSRHRGNFEFKGRVLAPLRLRSTEQRQQLNIDVLSLANTYHIEAFQVIAQGCTALHFECGPMIADGAMRDVIATSTQLLLQHFTTGATSHYRSTRQQIISLLGHICGTTVAAVELSRQAPIDAFHEARQRIGQAGLTEHPLVARCLETVAASANCSKSIESRFHRLVVDVPSIELEFLFGQAFHEGGKHARLLSALTEALPRPRDLGGIFTATTPAAAIVSFECLQKTQALLSSRYHFYDLPSDVVKVLIWVRAAADLLNSTTTPITQVLRKRVMAVAAELPNLLESKRHLLADARPALDKAMDSVQTLAHRAA